ncbi:hypothetical protein [Duganella sp. BJB475]|uniref:hypothetical protein n=1 Tax=Duganella sp. BJB475 TaxID=2233914 RepID=UPI000E345DF1|nr:hypothetical protein [Duganella sp. BJB475]RFP19171.1 hypothetical protein D0T23_05155 [Duganella sp. BJB475]
MTRRRSLTDDQVREIRAAHQPGVRGAGYESLARVYGVGASTIRDILTYRSLYAMAAESGAPAARTTTQGAMHV